MEEKKIIKLKLHSVIIITLAILLVIGIVTAVFLKSNNKDEEFKREPEAMVINPDNVVASEKKTNNGNTVKIRYAYTYNVPTADALNEMQNEKYGEDYIDILEIYLEGDKLTKINELIKNSSFEKADLSVYKDTKLAIDVAGTFEITINNDIVLLMDQEWSMYTKDSDSYIIHTPEELFNEISTIVYEKAYGNSKSYDTSKITIISKQTDGEDVIITDEKHIKSILDNLKYAKVNMNEDEMEDEEITYTVDLNNGVQVKVYFASAIGYIIDSSEKYYVAFVTDFEEIVSTLYENYIAGRN